MRPNTTLTFFAWKTLSVFVVFSLLLSWSGVLLFSHPTFAKPHDEEETGMIWGYKWEDINGNGEKDDGEPTLEGWTIVLDGEDSDSTETDEDGYYEFTELLEGDYEVCEELLNNNWIQTHPDEDSEDSMECDEEDGLGSWGYEVEVEEGDEVGELNFGNFEEGYISGHKYDWDSEEPIEDWTMYLIDTGDRGDRVRYRTTDEDGYYYFGDLGPGTYEVCELYYDEGGAYCGTHSLQVEPDGYYTIEMTSGAEGLDNPNYDFWNREVVRGSVHAFKYFDRDRDYEYDEEEGEQALGGWTLCLYGEGEYFIDPESCQESGDDGWIWWEVSPGWYWIEEHMTGDQEDEGWEMTSPDEGSYEVYIDEDGNVTYYHDGDEVDQADFGNWQEVEDNEPPVSRFDNPFDHEVIDTELVTLELTGISVDNPGGTGVRSAELSVWALGDPDFDLLRLGLGDPDFDLLRLPGDPDFDLLSLYPGQSFFDVFYELQCPPQLSEETIPIEIVSLSLTSVDPIMVTWEPPADWRWQPVPGVYCFEVEATDNAGNVEHTAWAGPLAYVPVPQISQESAATLENILGDIASLIVEWLTDHPATSRVVYDTISHPVLGSAPNYGYVFSTPEDSTLVTSHSVTISGLSSGTTYYYRTVSHGSPENVGGEQTFSIPSPPSPPPSFSTLSPDPATSTSSSEPQAQNEETSVSEESGEVTTQIPFSNPGEALSPQPPVENQQQDDGQSQSSSSPAGTPTTSSAPVTPVQSSEEVDINESVAVSDESILPENTSGGVTVTTGETPQTLSSNSLLASLVALLTPFQWFGVGAAAVLASLAGRKVWLKRGVKPSKPRKKS